MTPVTVLFACVHNAGRSQMAAALFNRHADPAKAVAVSAGTEPGDRVHPEVVSAMKEVGIDLSGVRPQKLTDALTAAAGVLITMGCGEACPAVPGTRREDWPLPDPKGQPIEKVRAIRDDVDARVRRLLRENVWGDTGDPMTTNLTTLCTDWLAAWTGNRPEHLLTFYAADAFYRDPAKPQGLKGHAELKPYLTKLLAKNPDWVWKAVEIIPTAKGFTLKWEATIPLGDRVVTEHGVDIVEIDEVESGKITRNEVYFDPSRLR